jgi:cation transport ATPase
VSIAVIGIGAFVVFVYFRGHFDDPVSKYTSKGEAQRMFLSMGLWPAVLLVVYVVVAGPPTTLRALLGDTSRWRRAMAGTLIVVAMVSSFYIGAYWLADNFPHPD